MYHCWVLLTISLNGFWLPGQALQTLFLYIYEVTSSDLLPSLPPPSEIYHKSVTCDLIWESQLEPLTEVYKYMSETLTNYS